MKKSLIALKKELKKEGMYIWPEQTRIVGNLGVTILPPVNNGKEYLNGYYQAKQGNSIQEKAAFAKRNAAAKYLREQGFTVWTEPKSHMGGTDTVEFALSSMRRK